MRLVIGGDTYPNKWFIKYATGADIAIHELFLTPDALVQWYGQSPRQALGVGTQIHTSPPAFGARRRWFALRIWRRAMKTSAS